MAQPSVGVFEFPNDMTQPAAVAVANSFIDEAAIWTAQIEPQLITIRNIQQSLREQPPAYETLVQSFKALEVVERALRHLYGQYKDLPATKALAQRIVPEHEVLRQFMLNIQARLKDMMPGPQHFEIVRALKDTIYGKVALGKHVNTGTLVAIKMSDVSGKVKSLEDPLKEIQIMRHIARAGAHPNVVQLLSEFRVQAWHWTVLEFCGGGEFFDVLASRGRGFDEAQARRYFRQIVSAVQHIHSAGIAHLDLSLENLLLDDKDNLKVCDFGMAREIPPNNGVLAGIRPGKLAYMAPEIFIGQAFNPVRADIYSIGVILFLMLTGTPPYKQPYQNDARFNLIHSGQIIVLLQRWGMDHLFSPAAIDLMNRMLGPSDQRPSIEDILKHPWMQVP